MIKVKSFEANRVDELEKNINEFFNQTGTEIIGTVPFQVKTMVDGSIMFFSLVTYRDRRYTND